MSLIRLNRTLNKPKVSRFLSTALQNEEEYTATPQYPPILDLSFEAKLLRKKQLVHEEIKKVKTIEEKQIKLNMPRYYGFKCYVFKEDQIQYNSLNLAQFITKTHILNGLPGYYKNIDVEKMCEYVKPAIEEAILMEYEGFRRLHELNKEEMSEDKLENLLAGSIIKQINRVLVNNLAQDYNHLLDTQIDLDPRIESFWFAGGMEPPINVKRYRRALEWMKSKENEPTDRAIQFFGKPMITLRHEQPLQTFIPHADAKSSEFPVPIWKYDPRTVGTTTIYQHAVNTPGFWPGDPHKFGLISLHNRGHMIQRLERFEDRKDDIEALHRQAILASYGWLNAQANFLGFTTFNEITYPLVSQTVITNGKTFSFYAYQLNTLLAHGKFATENPLSNICWVTPEMNLYDEIKEGKIINLNDDVLKILLKFYTNIPQERLGVNMTPYLSQEEKVIADYEDDDKRQWLEREYKYLVSNRPRYKLPYEIYDWEKIYKIDHQKMPLEPRRRPFELKQNPFSRRLDDRQAFYIPRKLRPDLPRYKGRYHKEYFP